jgi:hypothetical protein
VSILGYSKNLYSAITSILGKSLSVLCHRENTKKNLHHLLPLLGYREMMIGLSSKREEKGIQEKGGKEIKCENEMKKGITFLFIS